MPYDKPKITIDLEEYNDLQEKVKRLDSDSAIMCARKVVHEIMSANGNFGRAFENLKKSGISVSYTQSTRMLSWEDIIIRYDAPNTGK